MSWWRDQKQFIDWTPKIQRLNFVTNISVIGIPNGFGTSLIKLNSQSQLGCYWKLSLDVLLRSVYFLSSRVSVEGSPRMLSNRFL